MEEVTLDHPRLRESPGGGQGNQQSTILNSELVEHSREAVYVTRGGVKIFY